MENQTTQLAIVSDDLLLKHLNNLGLLKDLTDGEKSTYLEIAKAFHLNPFKREIHVSKYNNQMSIITGYEVYIKRAERTGLLDGWEVSTDGSVVNNTLKAIITIYRKDRKYPFKHEVLYSEYVQKTKDGHVNKFWQKAHTMIKKVAISQGFRLCFSDELGGMPYTQEELPEINKIEDVPNENLKLTIEAKPTSFEDIEFILSQATTLPELETAYRSLPKEDQSRHDVVDLAKKLKTNLTPQTK
jgi:phage recombination protein Bet